jgi:hypothetical protein
MLDVLITRVRRTKGDEWNDTTVAIGNIGRTERRKTKREVVAEPDSIKVKYGCEEWPE